MAAQLHHAGCLYVDIWLDQDGDCEYWDDLPDVVEPYAKQKGWWNAYRQAAMRIVGRLEKGLLPKPNCTGVLTDSSCCSPVGCALPSSVSHQQPPLPPSGGCRQPHPVEPSCTGVQVAQSQWFRGQFGCASGNAPNRKVLSCGAAHLHGFRACTTQRAYGTWASMLASIAIAQRLPVYLAVSWTT